jgi:hypothetical protein
MKAQLPLTKATQRPFTDVAQKHDPDLKIHNE